MDIGCGDGGYISAKSMGAKEDYRINMARKDIIAAKEKGIKAYELNKDGSSFEENYFDVVYCGKIKIECLFKLDNLFLMEVL